MAALNILRHPLRNSLRRTYASGTQFVPPASLRDLDKGFNEPPPPKPKPESPTFYTGRGTYYDQLISLETAIKYTQHALRTLQLYPLPPFARESLLPLQPAWKDRTAMSREMNTPLSTMRYRRLTGLLGELNDLQRIAHTAGVRELYNGVNQIISLFEKANKEAILARGKRKPVKFDEYGRTYTVGRRKTSSARVWMIPIQMNQSAGVVTSAESESLDLYLGPRPGETYTSPLSSSRSKSSVTVSPGSILLNNRPLSEYFSLPGDREKVVRPFKLTGTLGSYNVFAIVRGGGTTGQAGAVSQAIAKGLAAHDPSVEAILRKAKLLRRDPRMVERKKTGWAKARKRYTWVKR